jgi:hypothetical protein
MWKMTIKPKPIDRSQNARVKALVFDAMGRNPDVGISVNEIICNDPGQETVILIMVPLKKTAACKVSKAMKDVSDDDVRDALKQLAYTP